MRLKLRTLSLMLVVLMLGLAAPAQASWKDVIRDCAFDGHLNKTYSHKELQTAYDRLPSDANEYTDCSSVIRAALDGGNGNRGGAPPNGIMTPSGAIAGSPQDVKALSGVTSAKRKRHAVSIGGREVVPGNAGLGGVLGGLAGANDMPGSLVLAIAALAILALVTAFLAVREKVPLVRRVALRILGR